MLHIAGGAGALLDVGGDWHPAGGYAGESAETSVAGVYAAAGV